MSHHAGEVLDQATATQPDRHGWRSDMDGASKDEIIWLYRHGFGAVIGWKSEDPEYPWAFLESGDTAVQLTECCEDELDGRILPNGFKADDGPTHWAPLKPPPPPESS